MQEKGIQAAQAQLGQCKAQSSLIDARVNQPSSAVQSSTPVSAHGGVVPPAPSGNPPATSPSSPEGLEALVQDMDTYSPTAEAPLPAMGKLQRLSTKKADFICVRQAQIKHCSYHRSVWWLFLAHSNSVWHC